MAHFFPEAASVTDDEKTKVPLIRCPGQLHKRGVIFAAVENVDRLQLAEEYSKPNPQSVFFEDGEYAQYRNVLEDPAFPLDKICACLGPALSYFDRSLTDLDLDDAFVIHYNTNHQDTTVKIHTDPSDITVNLCLARESVQGSEILFYGRSELSGSVPCECNDDDKSDIFRVEPIPGSAMVHYGSHPHETLPLRAGQRTNCVITFRDKT